MRTILLTICVLILVGNGIVHAVPPSPPSSGTGMSEATYASGGLLKTSVGGTGLDTSTSTGFPSLSSGTWSILSASDMRTALGVQASLSLVAGTYADGNLCTYTASGTLLDCNTPQSTFLTNSGTFTDEQLACTETSAGTNQIKSCGAKTTDNSTASHFLYKDSDSHVENATFSEGITFHVNGGGSAITTGLKACMVAKYSMTLTGWTMIADQSGSIKVDVWKSTYANYQPTNADTITNGHEPEISSALKAQDADISDWTTVTVTAGDVLCFNVDSATTVTWVHLVLTGTRTPG